MLRHLDLFSGIGGFALAARMVGGIQTQQFVEIEPFCQKVLAKNFPGVPIHDDIRSFTPTANSFDLVTAGFPCQDISEANTRGLGLEGSKSGLFYEAMRIVCECKPRFVVLENVPAMLTKHDGVIMGTVLWELFQNGFNAEWQVVSAAQMGLPHRRERVFIVAYSDRFRRGCSKEVYESSDQEIFDRKKQESNQKMLTELVSAPIRSLPLSAVSRDDDGIPSGMDCDRMKALGNAIVPQCGAVALRRVLELNDLMES